VTGKDEKGLIQNKNGSKGKTQELVKKNNNNKIKTPPGAWMFVLCLLYKYGSMERKVT
jgi:hypothetical protein